MKIFFLALALGSFSFGSFGTRGGGNANCAEFYRLGQDLLEALVPLSPFKIQGIDVDIKRMNTLFSKTLVRAQNGPLRLNGASVEAINEPDRNRIEFDQKAWVTHPKELRSQLVIHEILGLARIPDPEFRVSRELLDIAVGKTDYDASNAEGDGLCSETRTFTGPKARDLIAALIHSGFDGREEENQTSYDLDDVQCATAHDLYGDGIGRVFCKSSLEIPASSAIELNQVLENMGLSGDSTTGHSWVEAEHVHCELWPETEAAEPSYRCTLAGTWSYGCRSPK